MNKFVSSNLIKCFSRNMNFNYAALNADFPLQFFCSLKCVLLLIFIPLYETVLPVLFHFSFLY